MWISILVKLQITIQIPEEVFPIVDKNFCISGQNRTFIIVGSGGIS